MKKNKLFILSISITLLIFSCNSSDTDANTTETSAEKIEYKIDGLALNNGEKWSANTETTSGINKMIEITSNLSENSTLAEFNAMGNELDEVKNQILNDCTMDGVAHDNLHTYLMPLLKKINGIQYSKTLDKANKIFPSVKMHLATYKDYFN